MIDSAATGREMRERRVAAGVSLREVARRMKLSAPFLSDLELGRRNWTAPCLERYERALEGGGVARTQTAAPAPGAVGMAEDDSPWPREGGE